MVGRFNFKILNKTLWTFYVHMETMSLQTGLLAN
jgi:hypothetical protein